MQNLTLQILRYLEKTKPQDLKKLDPRAKKAILVGFRNNFYRLYDINSKRVI